MGKKLLEKAGIAQKSKFITKNPTATWVMVQEICNPGALSSSLQAVQWSLLLTLASQSLPPPRPQQLFTPSGKLGERPQRIFQVSFPQRCDALLLPGSPAFSWRESLNEGDMVRRHAATSSSLHSHSSPQAPSCFLSFPMLHALFSTVSLLSLNSISVYLLNPVKCLSYFQNRFARGLRMQLPGGALEQFSPQLCFLWSLFL